MSNAIRRATLAGIGLLVLAVLGACVVGSGYSADVGVVGYSPGYVEPWGYEYGGWREGYRVGPPRGGERRPASPPHAYHGAPASRPTPSIPTRSRGGSAGSHR